MSVLKAKIHAQSESPRTTADVAVWRALQGALLDTLRQLSGLDLASSDVTPKKERLKTLRKDFNDSEAIFAIQSTLSKAPILVMPSRRLCAHIAARALQSERGYSAFEGEARYLDLMLCEPISAPIINFLQNKASSEVGPLDFTFGLMALNFDTFKMGSETASWTRIDLLFAPEDISEAQAKTKLDDEADASGAAEKASDNGDIMITLMCPEDLLTMLDFDLTEKEIITAKSDDSPWASHMLRSVGSARIRIRAVLDDYPMSVADCSRLHIGQVLALDGASAKAVRLETAADTGPILLGNAILGGYKSRRALKLNSDMNCGFLNG